MFASDLRRKRRHTLKNVKCRAAEVHYFQTIQQALYCGQMHNQQFLNALCCVTSFFTCEEFASKAMEVVIPTGSLCVGDAALSTGHNGSSFRGVLNVKNLSITLDFIS